MAVTIATIARRLNVSKVTISLALRGSTRVSAATRERVARTAAELGYTPNPLVRALMASLRENRRPTSFINLAFLTAFEREDGWRRHPTVVRYLDHARQHAATLGYGVEVHWAGPSGVAGERLTTILEARGIPGLILAPLPRLGMRLGLDWSRFATVAIGWSFNEVACHRVATNQFHSINSALAACHARGLRRIGLAVPGVVDEKSEHIWLCAYLGFLALHPELEKLEPLITEPFVRDTYLAWHKRWRPEVVITTHLPVREWLAENRPRKAAATTVVSLDWTAEHAELAGMDQQPEEIGAAAVELLVEQINLNRRGVPRVPKTVHLESRWRDASDASSPARITGKASH